MLRVEPALVAGELFCAFAAAAVVAASSAAVGFLAAKWMERRNGVGLASLK